MYQGAQWLHSRLTLCNPVVRKLARPLCPWDSPGKNAGMSCHFLLQGIFPTQGLNPPLLHCRQILYPLSHLGSHIYVYIHGIYQVSMYHTWYTTNKCVSDTDIYKYAATTAKSLQSCVTLCDPIDGSPPGSPVPGILQARTLEWVAISFSNAWKWKAKMKSLSSVRLFATPWTAAYQAPPSMGFSRQGNWSGVLLPLHKYATDMNLQ